MTTRPLSRGLSGLGCTGMRKLPLLSTAQLNTVGPGSLSPLRTVRTYTTQMGCATYTTRWHHSHSHSFSLGPDSDPAAGLCVFSVSSPGVSLFLRCQDITHTSGRLFQVEDPAPCPRWEYAAQVLQDRFLCCRTCHSFSVLSHISKLLWHDLELLSKLIQT